MKADVKKRLNTSSSGVGVGITSSGSPKKSVFDEHEERELITVPKARGDAKAEMGFTILPKQMGGYEI